MFHGHSFNSAIFVCSAMGDGDDHVTRCFHDNTEGCVERGGPEWQAVRAMWDAASSGGHVLCQHSKLC